MNVAKSRFAITNPITSRIDVYEATADGGVKVTRTDQRADGTAINLNFTYKYDGKEYPLTGTPYDTVSAKRIDANATVTVVKKTGGVIYDTSEFVVSKDGKTKTQTIKGTDATGKTVVSTYVYDKQ